MCVVSTGDYGRYGGGGGGGGGRYDDDEPHSYGGSNHRSSSSRSATKLDDINDWQDGKKGVVDEVIGKVKDFASKMKNFDDPPDFE